MKEAFKAFVSASYRSAFAVLGIALSIFMLVITANAAFVSYSTYSRIRDDIRIEVFPKVRTEEVVSFLKVLGGVDSVEIVSEEKARKEFEKFYPQLSDLLSRLGEDVFYPMVRVYPRDHWREVEFLDILSGEIGAYRGVAGVYYGREWLKAAQDFFKFLLGANVIVLLTAFVVSLLVSYYTVRFVVHHRRNLIEILRLAGVSPFRLRYPYVILSVMYALISWLLIAPVVLYLVRYYGPVPGMLKFNTVLLGGVLVVTTITTVMGGLRALSDLERGLR